MLLFHACYDMVMIFDVKWGFFSTKWVFYWQQMICIIFIFASGCIASFSKKLLKRGVLVSGTGIIITLITYFFMSEQIIWFGVLSLLGFCMILTYFIRPIVSKIPESIGAIIMLLLFIITRFVYEGKLSFFSFWEYSLPDFWYQNKWSAILGFPHKEFYSADYFPIVPWLFLYLFGFYLFSILIKLQDKYENKRFLYIHAPLFSLLGRNSFIIYILHQPIIYLICWWLSKIVL